jgi:hypothetical protein
VPEALEEAWAARGTQGADEDAKEWRRRARSIVQVVAVKGEAAAKEFLVVAKQLRSLPREA